MKTFFSIILLTLTTLNSFSLGVDLDANGLDLDMIGVRVLLNGTDESCSPAEVALTKASFAKAFSGGRRNLRTSRQLDPYECVALCRNWAPGHCYLAHPQCPSYRRLQGVQGGNHTGATLFDDDDSDYSAAAIERCLSEKQTVIGTLATDQASASFSPSCHALLSQTASLGCFLLVE